MKKSTTLEKKKKRIARAHELLVALAHGARAGALSLRPAPRAGLHPRMDDFHNIDIYGGSFDRNNGRCGGSGRCVWHVTAVQFRALASVIACRRLAQPCARARERRFTQRRGRKRRQRFVFLVGQCAPQLKSSVIAVGETTGLRSRKSVGAGGAVVAARDYHRRRIAALAYAMHARRWVSVFFWRLQACASVRACFCFFFLPQSPSVCSLRNGQVCILRVATCVDQLLRHTTSIASSKTLPLENRL